jgi:tRNA (mo5U34)-methyltransferase
LKAEILRIENWRHPFEVEPGVPVKLHRSWHKEWHEWRVQQLMPHVDVLVDEVVPGGWAAARVLDVGCWDGYYSFEFAKRGAGAVRGIDLRQEALRRANLLRDYFGYDRCRFEQGNIQEKDFAGETFDITLLSGVLYHLSSPIDVLKKIGAVTGSLLLINTYASRARDSVLHLTFEDPDKDPAGHQALVTFPSERALLDMLAFAGFDVVLRDYPYPFFPRYRDSDFGFFYALKSGVGAERLAAIRERLDVQPAYRPGRRRSQVVCLRGAPAGGPERPALRERAAGCCHRVIDRLLGGR